MEFVYMLLPDGAEWEDMVIILDKEEAIQASIKFYKCRVEVFKKSSLGYTPTYTYYSKGEYYGTPQ
jgi:squalene cyclase